MLDAWKITAKGEPFKDNHGRARPQCPMEEASGRLDDVTGAPARGGTCTVTLVLPTMALAWDPGWGRGFDCRRLHAGGLKGCSSHRRCFRRQCSPPRSHLECRSGPWQCEA